MRIKKERKEGWQEGRKEKENMKKKLKEKWKKNTVYIFWSERKYSKDR